MITREELTLMRLHLQAMLERVDAELGALSPVDIAEVTKQDVFLSLEKNFGRARYPGPLMISPSHVAEMLKIELGRDVSASEYAPVLRSMGFMTEKKRIDGKPTNVWRRAA